VLSDAVHGGLANKQQLCCIGGLKDSVAEPPSVMLDAAERIISMPPFDNVSQWHDFNFSFA